MKKTYEIPSVEMTELIAGSQALCTSPGAGIGSGGSTGGGGIPGSGPIPGE